MHFLTIIATISLVLGAALLGFAVGGLHERVRPAEIGGKSEATLSGSGVGLVFVALLIAVVCSALILVDPAVISPLWLQYVLLAAAPLIGGYAVRRLTARSLSARDNDEGGS